ncbi:MAG: matrixin family metalloprotease [Gemmatimonadales bacterium]
MVERRLSLMISAAAVFIVLFILWDVFRPEPRPGRGEAALDSQLVLVPVPGATAPAASAPPVLVAPASTSQAGAAGPLTNAPSNLELLARSQTRRRIRASASTTYLNEMLAASSDSMLRRWDNRTGAAVQVWFAPTNAANFQPSFRDAIRTAFGQWADVGVPVRFVFVADSSEAEVVIRWRIQFEIERTGQTDLTWDENGHLRSAAVTFATFDPKGRPMEADDVRVVALHEVGHLLGLDHSADSTDIMYPTAKVRELSERDVRTVLLLYQLAAGSLR